MAKPKTGEPRTGEPAFVPGLREAAAELRQRADDYTLKMKDPATDNADSRMYGGKATSAVNDANNIDRIIGRYEKNTAGEIFYA